jgi:uncharacterized protein YkwD
VESTTVNHGTWTKRTAQRLLAVLSTVLVCAALVGPGASPATAAPSASGAEMEFLQLLNRTRSDHGLAALQSDPGLIPIAREWSGAMASASKLSHRQDLAAQVEARVTRSWTRVGENVGRGGSVAGLHDAFLASPGHRANVVGQYNRVGVGVVITGDTIWVTFNFMQGPAITGATGGSPPSGNLWMTSAAGEVWAYGSAPHRGAAAGGRLAQPVVGMARTPSGNGYWLVAGDGGIFTYGDAGYFGSTGAMRLQQPIVGMAPTPTGNGYWLVAGDGGIFAFGDAKFRGSTGGMRLNQPVLGMASTPSGDGYWLVARDGGIFAFGGARFQGSTGAMRLQQPIVGMASTRSGRGYWLTAADGGVFAFGDAPFHGSTGGTPLSAPISGIATTPSGGGYRMVGRDGRVYSFGDAGSGVSGPVASAGPVVGLALR